MQIGDDTFKGQMRGILVKAWKHDELWGRDRLGAFLKAVLCGGLETPEGLCERERALTHLGFRACGRTDLGRSALSLWNLSRLGGLCSMLGGLCSMLEAAFARREQLEYAGLGLTRRRSLFRYMRFEKQAI